MTLVLILTAGKYLLALLLYLFVVLVFKRLMSQAATPPPVAPAVTPTLARPRPTMPAPVAAPVVAPVRPVPPPAPVRAEAQPRLVVLRSQSLPEGQVVALTARVTLGRGAENNVALGDRFASGEHAVVFLQGTERFVRDQGSTNGTFVNGQRITGEVALRPGDEITVGTTVLKYVE